MSLTQVKEEGAYLYPNLAKAIVGCWKTKQSENYSTAEYRLGLKEAVKQSIESLQQLFWIYFNSVFTF